MQSITGGEFAGCGEGELFGVVHRLHLGGWCGDFAGDGASCEVGDGVGALAPDLVEIEHGAVRAEFGMADVPIGLAGGRAGGGALAGEVGVDGFEGGGERILDDEVAGVVGG